MQISEFLKAAEDELFIGDLAMQKEMTMLGLKSLDADLLTILCFLAQNHPNEAFPTNLLTKQLAFTATIDQIIDVIGMLHRLPLADMFEKVLSKGSVEQIHRLNAVRASWLYSDAKDLDTKVINHEL